MHLGVLAFDTGPVTLTALVTYALILFLSFWTDELQNIPKDQKGLDLAKAYTDLHHIAARPHPFNSHANDYVRTYILEQVRATAKEYGHVTVFDDLRSNGSWASSNYGVYFEGTNILVKIDGTEPRYADQGGVLFSAHYDSVSTAPGATDDGMGVATLLELVRYFSENRPRRTAVFNINNGEEDWLNGAHAFLQHPWSRIPDSFLNLEGAAAGGRPILFRATSDAVVRAFRSKHVDYPHANVLSADAFKRGFIRSGTDYSIYTEGAKMQGLDLAFYKGRSKYHTKYDAIPYTDGQEKSLWAMLDTARGAGTALLNDDKTHDPERYRPVVYFDLFGTKLVRFSLETLYIFNIIFLVLGPIILAGFMFAEAVIKAGRSQERDERHQSLLARIFTDFKLLWRWAKFWVAILVTAVLQVLFVFIFIKANPYIIYSYTYTVLFSLTVVSYITFTWIITYDISTSQSDNQYTAEQQKETVLLQSYSLSWIVLLLSTIAIGKAQIGGLYLVTYWSVGLWIACGLASLETMFSYNGKPAHKTRSRSRSSSPSHRNREHNQAGPSERTPLMNDHDNGYSASHAGPSGTTEAPRNRTGPKKNKENETTVPWWLFQFFLVVPMPVILAIHIGIMLLDATCQTLADGNSKIVVYASASLVGFLLVLPLAPFSFKLHKGISYLLLFFFVFVTLWATVWKFPFSSDTPLKVYFQQIIRLEGSVVSFTANNSNSNHYLNPTTTPFTTSNDNLGIVKTAYTNLIGVPDYLQSIISKLPSASNKNLDCYSSGAKAGLTSCSWRSGYDMIPQPGSSHKSKTSPVPKQRQQEEGVTNTTEIHNLDQQTFFRAELTRTSRNTAQIAIQGKNTKNCRIYFDNRPITRYTIEGGLPEMQPPYEITSEGIKELRLWSRDWDKTFIVNVQWKDYLGLGEGLRGRIACEWAEYGSASSGVPGQGQSKGKGGFRSASIPALEEVLSFLPTWVVVSKHADGLVEAWEGFSV